MTDYSSRIPWNKPKVLPWVILLFAAMNVIFLGGKRRAFGGYIAEIRKEFSNVTLTELNWIGDSYAALGHMSVGLSITMILYFNRRYGLFQFIGAVFILLSCITSSFVPNPHWLFLTHTLLHGIGSSLILANVGLVVNEHFDLKHPFHILATTLISGGSLGSIIFVPLFAFLIQQFNWRIAFVILGCIYFVVNGSAAIFFKKNDDLTEISSKKKMSCNCDEISKKQIPLLCLWFTDRILASVVTYGLLLNLTDYVHRIQPDLLRSSILTTLFAAGEASTYIIAAVITGLTRDLFKERLRYILFISSLIMAAALMTLEFTCTHVIARRLLCFISGFAIGPSLVLAFPAGEELTRLPGHVAYPFTLSGIGVGMLLSPLLTAKIAELLAYKWFFMVQSSLIFLKALCLLIIIFLLSYYNNNPNDEDTKELLASDEEIEVEGETAKLVVENKTKA